MHPIEKAILTKLAWIALAFVAFYFVGSALNLVPESVKDTIAWFAANFTQVVILICFLIGYFIFLKVMKRRRENY